MSREEDAALLHWWVVLSLGAPGRTLTLTREEAGTLASLFPATTATIEDPIEGGSREVPITFDALSQFSFKGVVARVPHLGELLTFAADLDDTSASPAALGERLPPGPLRDELVALATPAGGTLDGADLPSEGSKAAKAVDSFVRSMQSTSRVKRSKTTRQIRDRIEEAVYTFARRVLASNEVASREATWRGLDLLLARCPKKAAIVVELLDRDLDGLPELIEAVEPGESAPDAVFVPMPIGDVGLLHRLAAAADLALVPVIVELDSRIFDTDAEGLPDVLSVEPGKLPRTDWLALRQEESSRWLCVTTHRVLLAYEGAGTTQRELFASSVWPVAAMLSESFRTTGGFARILGSAGSLTVPAARVLAHGAHEGQSSPTESFYPIKTQTQLAKHGLVAIGSVRDRATVVLLTAPMLRASIDAAALPAQIVTGRIVRFASWVRDQLPADADEATIAAVFAEAGRVFLFPGLGEAASLEAKLVPDSEPRAMSVRAVVHPAIAGTLLDIEFPLALTSG